MSYMLASLFGEESEDMADSFTYPVGHLIQHFRSSSSVTYRTFQLPRRTYLREDGNKVVPRTGNVSLSSTPYGLRRPGASSAYAVPSGRSARLFMLLESRASDGRFDVWESDSADSATGTRKINYTASDFDNNLLTSVIPEWSDPEITFGAGKYINVRETNGDITMHLPFVIESDA